MGPLWKREHRVSKRGKKLFGFRLLELMACLTHVKSDPTDTRANDTTEKNCFRETSRWSLSSQFVWLVDITPVDSF
jgi:hypothetical protein